MTWFVTEKDVCEAVADIVTGWYNDQETVFVLGKEIRCTNYVCIALARLSERFAAPWNKYAVTCVSAKVREQLNQFKFATHSLSTGLALWAFVSAHWLRDVTRAVDEHIVAVGLDSDSLLAQAVRDVLVPLFTDNPPTLMRVIQQQRYSEAVNGMIRVRWMELMADAS